MIPISDKAKALFDAERRQVLRLTGTDGNGNPISITDADVMERGFSIDRFCCNGEKLEIGTAIAAEMNVKLDNRTGKFNGIVFGGSELTAEIGVADWPAMETAKNLFVGTLEPAVTPASEIIRLSEQTNNTVSRPQNVLTEAEHGIRVTQGGTPTCWLGMGYYASPDLGAMQGFEAGKTYTVSFDYTAKLYSGTPTGTLVLYCNFFYAEADDTAWQHYISKGIVAYTSADYGQEKSGTFSFTFTVPDGTVAEYLSFAANNTVEYSAVGDFFELRNMMLVEGDTPAAWTPAYEEVSEVYYMPCGVFVVDEQPRTLSIITLTALDRMVKFDKAIGNLTLPCTVENLIAQCCTVCGVTLGQSVSTMPNANLQIAALPDSGQVYTYRMLILWAAGVMGSNAYMDWNGQLRFSWYDGTSGYISSTSNRFSSDMYESDIEITGFVYVGDDNTEYMAGTDEYTIYLDGNVLVNGSNAENVLPAIESARQGLIYRPFSSSSVCAPYLMPMDRISFVDAGGNSHVSVLTNVNLTINGATSLQAVGETDAVNARTKPGSFTQNQETELRKIQHITDSRMDTAIENATAQITGADGGYVRFMYNANGKLTEILIMDTEDVTTATKVWRWNSGGLGYSSNGYGGPYALAMTQDGAIVADFVTTGTLDGTKINAKLLNIVDANGDVVASFNDAIVLGKSGQARAELDFNSFEIVDSGGNVIATIGDTASSDGYTHITEDYVGTGTQTRFELSQAYSSIVAIVSVTVDGVVADPSTYSLTAVSSTAYLRFTSAPASGAAIGIEYTVSGSFWHYDFGSRSSGIIGHKSMVHGDGNLARGMYSFASGEGLQAHQRDHHVFGSYNVPDTSGRAPSSTKGVYIEIVGNGDSDSNRSNARTLDWNGNEYIAGALNVGNAATTRANIGAMSDQDTQNAIGTAIDGTQNLFVNTLNMDVTTDSVPEPQRPRIYGQTGTTSGVGLVGGALHGIQSKSNVSGTNRPYIAFGDILITSPNAGMNGLVAGRTYTWSFDYETKLYSGTISTEQYLRASFRWASSTASSYTILQETVASWNASDKGTVKSGHFTYTFTVPDNAAKIYLFVGPSNTSQSAFTIGDYIQLKNLMLANSTYSSIWIPSVHDIAPKALTKVVSGTTNATGEISLALDGTRYAVISAVSPTAGYAGYYVANVFVGGSDVLTAFIVEPNNSMRIVANESVELWVTYLDLGAGAFP